MNERDLSAYGPVLVTGVSSGIGRAVAVRLAGAGVPVIGSVRREADAAPFVEGVGPLARAVLFDLRDERAIRAAAAEVGRRAPNGVAALVNNAGIAVPGPLEHLSLADFRDQIEVNLVGTLAVTQAFLPLLSPGGRIVNISSVSGATAMPFLGAYAASKFGLEALSDSLRRELIVRGIDVIVVQPGGVRTPIWEKAAAEDTGRLAGGMYEHPIAAFRDAALATGDEGLDPDAVGSLVLHILRARRPRARYLVTRHPLTERIMRLLPARLLDRLIARRLSLRR